MILSVAQLEVFLFILARVAGVFIQAPIFSSRSFPALTKIAFAVWLSPVLWLVAPVTSSLPFGLTPFIATLAAEVALGFLIGFVCNIIFIALQSAGEIIGLPMGLSVDSAPDTVFGAVISNIGRLTFFIALIVFLTLDGHHLILAAFHQSLVAIPAGKIANFISPDLYQQISGLGALLWLTAIKISAPIVLLIFLSDFTFGIVSRVAPQVNVFMLGFQVKPLLGIFGLLVILPLLLRQIGVLTQLINHELVKLLMFLK